MLNLIVGKKGSGKTKKLIDLANNSVEKTKGHVIVVEKGKKLTYDISHQIRLIDTDDYAISSFDALYGFLSGICAGDYDVTDILIDSTLKICGNDLSALVTFIKACNKLTQHIKLNLVFLISAEQSELSTEINDIVSII